MRNIANIDCKQNILRRFQTVNLLFLSRNWATFASKVAQFLVVNKWVFKGELAILLLSNFCPQV